MLILKLLCVLFYKGLLLWAVFDSLQSLVRVANDRRDPDFKNNILFWSGLAGVLSLPIFENLVSTINFTLAVLVIALFAARSKRS
jgi:hypothetical protein